MTSSKLGGSIFKANACTAQRAWTVRVSYADKACKFQRLFDALTFCWIYIYTDHNGGGAGWAATALVDSSRHRGFSAANSCHAPDAWISLMAAMAESSSSSRL